MLSKYNFSPTAPTRLLLYTRIALAKFLLAAVEGVAYTRVASAWIGQTATDRSSGGGVGGDSSRSSGRKSDIAEKLNTSEPTQ